MNQVFTALSMATSRAGSSPDSAGTPLFLPARELSLVEVVAAPGVTHLHYRFGADHNPR